MPALRRILVPVDGSEPSLAALAHAVALASDSDARVEVLRVIEAEPRRLSSMSDEEAEPAILSAVEHAKETLGGSISYRTITGDPVREIVLAGRDSKADLIVIGTHGRVGRLRSLLGSVAEGVVRNATCPVMTVRDPEGGYQSFAEHRHGRPAISEITDEQHPPVR